jgi:hypothetical protein
MVVGAVVPTGLVPAAVAEVLLETVQMGSLLEVGTAVVVSAAEVVGAAEVVTASLVVAGAVGVR